MRIARYLAQCTKHSRRKAEVYITQGRVTLNGAPLTDLSYQVKSGDEIRFDDVLLVGEQESPSIWCYHKLPGFLVTRKDERHRPTIFEELPDHLPHLYAIGRLDYNSEGLLLLSNSGDLVQQLSHPSFGWKRTYRVRTQGEPIKDIRKRLKDGITIEDVHYAPIQATLDTTTGRNSWYSLVLSEGKNREIRRIFTHFNAPVSRLIRTGYGPFELGDLKPGEIKQSSIDINSLLKGASKA